MREDGERCGRVVTDAGGWLEVRDDGVGCLGMVEVGDGGAGGIWDV